MRELISPGVPEPGLAAIVVTELGFTASLTIAILLQAMVWVECSSNATLFVTRRLQASISIVSSGNAILTVGGSLSGQIAASLAVSGSLAVSKLLGGTIIVSSGNNAVPVIQKRLSGLIVADLAASNSLAVGKQLTATIASFFTATSDLSITSDGLIPGYDAWWDASQSIAVAIDGSNGVDQLNDLSGNSKHLTLTSTAKPTYLIGSSGINGLNCLDFTDTTLRHLTTGFFAANYSGTVLTSYAVGSIAQVGNNFRRMLTAANGTGSDSTPTTACMIHCSINTTGSPIGSFRGNVTRSNLAQSPGTVYVHACVYDGTNNTYYLNSVAGTPVAVTGAFGFNRYRITQARQPTIN